MHGIGGRLWSAQCAITKETTDLFKNKTQESDKEKLTSLERRDIIVMGAVSSLLAFGMGVLLAHLGSCFPSDNGYAVLGLSFTVLSSLAFTAALTIPLGTHNLLKKQKEAHFNERGNYQNIQLGFLESTPLLMSELPEGGG